MLDVDWVLYEMHRTLKSIEDEIKLLQRKFCYEDFISDLICIVSRDITGGALEIQHYAPPSAYQGQQSPHRQYYNFRSALACRPTVIQAARKRSRKFICSKLQFSNPYFQSFRRNSIGFI